MVVIKRIQCHSKNQSMRLVEVVVGQMTSTDKERLQTLTQVEVTAC